MNQPKDQIVPGSNPFAPPARLDRPPNGSQPASATPTGGGLIGDDGKPTRPDVGAVSGTVGRIIR